VSLAVFLLASLLARTIYRQYALAVHRSPAFVLFSSIENKKMVSFFAVTILFYFFPHKFTDCLVWSGF